MKKAADNSARLRWQAGRTPCSYFRFFLTTFAAFFAGLAFLAEAAFFLAAGFALALAGASSGINLLAMGEPSPVQASHPDPAEKAPLLP
jgi:hypothetical protein